MAIGEWNMPYHTNVDIERRLGAAVYLQLTDDNEDGVADVAVVDEARLGAEAEVDSILARRIRVPVDLAVHPELAAMFRSVALDLSEARLRARRPPASRESMERAALSREWLRRIGDGILSLPSLSEIAPSATSGITGVAIGDARLLSRDGLADF